MILKKITFIVLVLSLVVLLPSCSTELETGEIEMNGIELYTDGPLFEGSNTVQFEANDLLTTFAKTKGIELASISEARLTKCLVYLPGDKDSSNLLDMGSIQSIALQLASDNIDMQSVAVLNPVVSADTAELKVAQTQEEIKNLVQEKVFYIVADANISEDVEANLKLMCNLKFEIKYKK